MPQGPIFGNIKMTPLTVKDFKTQFNTGIRWTPGFTLVQYTSYINQNVEIHHYGGCETKEDWLAAQFNAFIKDNHAKL